MVINNASEGGCVTQGEGGIVSYKKKYLYIRTTKCLNNIKISTIDIDLMIEKLPQNPKVWCFLYFMNEKFNSNAKVEQLIKMLSSCEEEKGIIVKDPLLQKTLLHEKYLRHGILIFNTIIL